jgi:hypothetical protein
MTDFERNTRTLIVCFVIGIFTLLPLRFYEEGQRINELRELSEQQVLGVSDIDYGKVRLVSEEEVKGEEGLEAPYQEIEFGSQEGDYLGVSCISIEEAESVTSQVRALLEKGEVSDEQRQALNESYTNIMSQVCQ